VPIFGILITNKMATYLDIRDKLEYCECLDLLDIVMVNTYNEKVIQLNNKDES
jgi:hypothetical protein